MAVAHHFRKGWANEGERKTKASAEEGRKAYRHQIKKAPVGGINSSSHRRKQINKDAYEGRPGTGRAKPKLVKSVGDSPASWQKTLRNPEPQSSSETSLAESRHGRGVQVRPSCEPCNKKDSSHHALRNERVRTVLPSLRPSESWSPGSIQKGLQVETRSGGRATSSKGDDPSTRLPARKGVWQRHMSLDGTRVSRLGDIKGHHRMNRLSDPGASSAFDHTLTCSSLNNTRPRLSQSTLGRRLSNASTIQRGLSKDPDTSFRTNKNRSLIAELSAQQTLRKSHSWNCKPTSSLDNPDSSHARKTRENGLVCSENAHIARSRMEEKREQSGNLNVPHDAGSSDTSSSCGDLELDGNCGPCPTSPRAVIGRFGLDPSTKPPHFDRHGSFQCLGGFMDSSAVSCGGRSNWEWKRENQDNFLMQGNEQGDAAFFGVFDGHGVNGGIVSSTVRDQFSAALRGGDGMLWKRIRQHPDETLKKAFLEIDGQLSRRPIDFSRSGSTAAVLIVDHSWVCAAWAGDSRIVLGRGCRNSDTNEQSMKAIDLSKDHKPDDPNEKKRILASNGRIDRMIVNADGMRAGPYRVYLKYVWQPGLATSRSFGDTMAKMVGVTSEPDIYMHRLEENDEFVILASDGVWEVVSSQEAVELVKEYSSPESAAKALVASAQNRWLGSNGARMCDDVTAIVCFLDHKKEPSTTSTRKAILPPLLPSADIAFPEYPLPRTDCAVLT